MMKKVTFLAAVITGIVLAQPALASESVQAGSADAARNVGVAFVSLIQGVTLPAVVVTQQPSIQGDWASLQTKAAGKVCDLTLQRNLTANKDGWVVTNYNCH